MKQQSLYEQSLDYFLSPLRPLLEDESVTEILINGIDQIYFEREGQLRLSSLQFSDEPWMAALAQNVAEFVGRKLDAEHHSLSGQLPENSCAKNRVSTWRCHPPLEAAIASRYAASNSGARRQMGSDPFFVFSGRTFGSTQDRTS